MTRITGEWLVSDTSRQVIGLFETSGYQIFFVGGCVRNALLDVPVSDLDLATDAPPAETMRLAEAAGLKAVGTGIDHGTVTIVADHVLYEVTTFRADKETDGRRARVQFSTDPMEDAHRRDFTMNGLYADRHGDIQDWVGGLADVKARRVRFIGDAKARIAEDYLRILRFFRFHAWYGDPSKGIDPDGLAACAQGQDGLSQLSPERVGAEMRKLLGAADPAPAIASMAQSGILAAIMPGSDDRALAPLIHLEDSRPQNWLRRAAVLGGADPKEVWRLSRADARALALLREKLGTPELIAELGYHHGAEIAVDIGLCRAAILGTALPPNLKTDAERGAAAKFPIRAADLLNLEGPVLGAKLKELEIRWIGSNFTLTRTELLDL